MAIKVTASPEHIGLALAEIVTDAVKIGSTDIVMELDVSGDPVAHVNDEVMIQVMVSPSLSVVLE